MWELPLIHPTILPFVYSIPPSYSISKTSIYKNNYIICGNLSSLLCIHLLQVRPYHTVLDLCCAPGTKLIALAQELSTCIVDPLIHEQFFNILQRCDVGYISSICTKYGCNTIFETAKDDVARSNNVLDEFITKDITSNEMVINSNTNGIVMGIDTNERRM